MKYILKPLPVLLLLLQACSGNSGTAEKAVTDSPAKKAADTTPAPTPAAVRPAIINIIDTIAPKRLVVCFKDSAANFERIQGKLAQIYGVKLAEVLKKNNLAMDGAPMAWYKSNTAPYFFEAGIPVAKKPAKLTAGAFIKELPADSVVLAHFYGPYKLLEQGYDALKEWMKDGNKKAIAAPYEIYIGDPYDSTGKPIDPYKVRTDIVFPRK